MQPGMRARYIIRAVMGLDDLVIVVHDQGDAAPDTCRHDSRHDIPAVHVRRFPNEELLRIHMHRIDGVRILVIRGTRDRRAESYHNVVRSSAHDGVRDVELLRDKHVLTPSEMHAVEPHIGDAVEAVEAQRYAFTGFGRSVERAPIPPLPPLVFREPQDVVTDIRIVVNDPGAHEVELHVAGNLR